ncbi:lysine 2,3-aminomutase [Acetobacter orientalis]|uniref:Lysine 2,3-aminomutase n=1 Tax=Acetobacter orientalis TaxID=146474 RepID=A0A2Z5ZGL5_9PROT|nr:lysine 2,3-aminomutase [Acetobacter orientalis]
MRVEPWHVSSGQAPIFAPQAVAHPQDLIAAGLAPPASTQRCRPWRSITPRPYRLRF